ncbi:hypothetical protein GCM10010199_30000 [Dactylosporangium roseum]
MGLCAAAVLSLSAGLSSPAAAAPSPSSHPSPAASGAGQAVCTPDGRQVSEISGLVATATGFYAIQDSQSGGNKAKIFQLDSACKVVGTISYPSTALDPEDLAIDKTGTLWIADIGDNDEASGGSKDPRRTIAVWSLPAGSKEPTIHRLAYPDGKKHDAEAMLLAADGSPIIITKTPASEVWVPEGPLQPKAQEGVKLKKVGSFTAQDTKTPNPLGLLGWKLVTGAAASPDGSKVVIRTYSDAYEFDVPGGDVVKAITTGKPRITPLPNEPQGESITYSADGKTYITASDVDSAKKVPLLRYTPTNISPGKGAGANLPAPKGDDQSFLESLTLQDITYAVAAIGIVGLILVAAGIFGIRRARMARRNAPPAAPVRAAASVGGPGGGFGGRPGGGFGGDPRGDPFEAGPPGGSGGPGGPGGAGGTVYGARPAAPATAPAPANRGGTVYGAAPSSPGPAGYDQDGPDRDGPVYGRGGSGSAGHGQQPSGTRGFGQQGGFPPPPPPPGQTGGVYGRSRHPGDHDGYDRGYAPHR